MRRVLNEASVKRPTPSIDDIFREAEQARRISSGRCPEEGAIERAAEQPEASTEIESKAIVHAIVMDSLVRQGRAPQGSLSAIELGNELDVEAQFTIYNTLLKSSRPAHPSVCYTRDDDGIDIIIDHVQREIREKRRKREDTSRQDRPVPCILRSMPAGHLFQSFRDGKWYTASGDVYVCESSGCVHHCTESACKHLQTLAGKEGLVCAITGRFYQPGFIHNNDTTTRRFRDSRDGAIAAQGGAGVALDTWKPTRTPEQRRAFRVRGRETKSKSENEMNALRASNQDSSLYYVRLDEVKERLDGREAELAIQAFRHTKAHSPQTVLTLLEFEMRKRFPLVPPPVLTTEMRQQVNEQCKNMLYTAPAFVRAENYKRLAEAEARAKSAIASYYREKNARNERADPFFVASRFIEETLPHYERLLTIGLSEPPRPDKALLLYLEESVIAVWLMLYYTPRARRFHSGVQLLNNVVGILYKLQTGVFISAGEEKFVVIPRHEFLDRLPQKSDLNRYYQRHETGASSEASITSEKLIDECFSKLPTDRDILEAFSLARYIKLWDEV